MRIQLILPISKLNDKMPKKVLTVSGCCDIVSITTGTTIVMFGKNQFNVTVVHCSNCGSVKATSNIKERNSGRQ